jgi:hypothetical protein
LNTTARATRERGPRLPSSHMSRHQLCGRAQAPLGGR